MKWTRDNVNERLIIRDFALGRELEACNEQVLYCFVITIAPTNVNFKQVPEDWMMKLILLGVRSYKPVSGEHFGPSTFNDCWKVFEI